jgi:membrane-associated phospholipid phosphatase
VVFPSFHATLAVLCACAAWPLRIAKYRLLALNLLITLSSPAMGGHYFIDIIAGIILAALTISRPGHILSGIWRLNKNMRHADAPVFASK